MRKVTAVLGFAALACGCASSPSAVPRLPSAATPATVIPRAFPVAPLNAPAGVFPNVSTTEPTGIRERYITATVTLTTGATLGGLYNRKNETWVQIAYPGAQSTAAYGPRRIEGGYLVAAAASSAAGHAFLYNSATGKFGTIDVANAVSTTAYGIWGDGKTVAIAGGYTDKKGRHAYVRTLGGNHFLTYDYPRAALTHFEGITGAGGPGDYNVAGDYTKPRDKAVYGFFMHIQNWKPWPPIVIGKLTANSVDVRDVVGVYNPGGGVSGFITTLPVQDPPFSDR